jgi:hypothetical protein
MKGFGRVALVAVGLVALALISTSLAEVSDGFIENRGQVDSRVRYYCPGSRATVYFTDQAVVMDVKEEVADADRGALPWSPDGLENERSAEPGAERGCAVYLRFEGSNAAPQIEARAELPGRHNYFLGRDPSKWRTDVPAYGEVVYREVWPGVDLAWRLEDGALTYAAVLSQGADAATVRFRYEGADRVISTADGSWLVETAAGILRDERGAEGGGGSGALVLERGNQESLGDGDLLAPPDNPPELIWSTFVGGSSIDALGAVALDSSENPVFTYTTSSADFPTTPGAYDRTYNGGAYDAMVAKLSRSGSTLMWSTLLGGSGDDGGFSLTVDGSGNVALVGNTLSSDFPTTPEAYDTSYNGARDAFVAELSASGSALLWSTFLGGGGDDYPHDLAFDAAGSIAVTGQTSSSNFPTTSGAYDCTYNGGEYDGFVAKLSDHGNDLVWSTFLGGSASDGGFALTIDSSGNAIVTGGSYGSIDFPTTSGAYDRSYNGGWSDAFVSKISESGDSLLWSTFLGGSSFNYDYGYDITLDSQENPVVIGMTKSVDFPTTPGAYDRTHNGGWCDVFVTKLSSSGSALVWSTFLGGAVDDYGNAVTLDSQGNAFVTGPTTSTDFPATPGAYDMTHNGATDAFVSELSASGDTLLWSTFLGGSDIDWGGNHALALDSSGHPFVVGGTKSSNFPTTTGAYDGSWNGDYDAFVARFAPSCVEAWVGDVTRTEAREVRVPIEISGAGWRGIYSVEATITYDPAIIDPTGYDVTGTMVGSQGWSVAWNETAPGRSKVSAAGVSELGGEGTLVVLTFERTDGAQCRGCTDLGLEVMFNEGEPCVTVTGGSYCLPPEAIAGAVAYFGCPALGNTNPPVPEVDLVACPHPLPPDCAVQVGATDSAGEYRFEVCQDTCYTVTPGKERLLEGPAISAFDASLVLRYTVSLESLTVCPVEPMLMPDSAWCPEDVVYAQRVAADVSGNGTISAYDASMILKYAVGILEGDCGEWDFYCERREYCPVAGSYDGEDYVGVLLGDVSGNWGLGGGYFAPTAVSGTLRVGDVTGVPGGLVSVPIYLETSSGILSVQLGLAHDPGLLAPESVRACGVASGCQVAWNALEHQTRIALAGTGHISGNGQILEVIYRVAPAPHGEACDLTPVSILADEGRVVLDGTPGEFRLEGASVESAYPDKPYLRASPNPSTGTITLDLGLPEASWVRVSIYDAVGRLVREVTDGDIIAAGRAAMSWDRRTAAGAIASSGIYFVRAETRGRVMTLRLVLVE